MKKIKKGCSILIDGSWFDDNQNRGYLVEEDNEGTYIIHGGEEKIYTEDIPTSKITLFNEQSSEENGLFS